MIYFLILIISLNFFYASGKLILDIFFRRHLVNEENTWLRTFLYLYVGLFISVLLYSIIITKGITVNALAFIPLGYIVFKYPPKWEKGQLKLKDFFNYKINLIAIVLFVVQMIFVLDGWHSFRWDFYPDIDYYSEYSYYLNQGSENSLRALNALYFKGYNIRAPYHYFELWIAAFLAGIFCVKSYSYILVMVVSPLLFSIFCAGVLCIFNHYEKKVNWIKIFLCLILIFVGPMNCFFNKFILNSLENYFNNTIVVFENSTHFNHFLLLKNLPFYSLCCLTAIFFLKGLWDIPLVIISFVIILNVGLLPGIYCGIILFIGYLVIRKKIKIRMAITISLLFLLLIVGFYLFYSIFSAENQMGSDSVSIIGEKSLYPFFQNLNLKGEITRFLYRLFFPGVWLIILYLFYIIIFVFTYKKTLNRMDRGFKNLSLFTGLVIIMGICSRPFTQGTDSPQLLSVLLPLLNITLIAYFIKAFQSFKTLVIVSALLGVVINFMEFSVYTKEIRIFNPCTYHHQCYMQNVKNEIGENVDVKIGWLLSNESVSNTSPGLWKFGTPARFLKTSGYYNFYNLNDPFIKYTQNSMLGETTDNQLKFIKNAKMKNYDQLLLEFINTYSIKYIATSANTHLPDFIVKKIKMCFIDQNSKEQFLVLGDLNSQE